MKYKHLLAAMTLFLAIGMQAQESEKTYPNAYVGLQGGAMRNYNGQNIDRKWSPMGALSLGYNFTKVFGLRLQANGSMWKASLPANDEYKSKALNVDLDMMFNFSNIFFPSHNNRLNIIGIAGVPFELAIPHAWIDNYAQSVGTGSKWNEAWKAGGMIEYDINRNWGINVEGGANYVRQDKTATADNRKWWPYVMAGVSYRFGMKKVKKAAAPVVAEPVAAPATNAYVAEEPAPAPQPAPKPVPAPAPVKKAEPKPAPAPVAKAPVKATENIFFDLGEAGMKSDQAAKIDKIVKFANDNPDAKITLTGYADKATGTADINRKLSEKRAAMVKQALVKKGVKANRITTDYKGDTVQPFANNDDNRAVIVVSEQK